MRIKEIFGFCKRRGCRGRRAVDMRIRAYKDNGKPKILKARLCHNCAIEILKIGKITSVTYGRGTSSNEKEI